MIINKSFYDKAQKMADKLHASAKDGELKLNNKLYIFTFLRPAGVYSIAENNTEIIRFNTRKITVAKQWLKEYFQN